MYEQSGVVPFRITDGEIEILFITSRRRKRWILPKGFVEPGMSPVESAAKEALEEAGVIGTIYDMLIGEYTYHKWGNICHMQVFPLKVKKIFDEWEESGIRKRKWISIEEAVTVPSGKKVKEIIKKMPVHIKKICGKK